MENDSKVCNGCSLTLPLTGFHKQHTRPDGRRSICKTCLAAKARPYLLAKRFGITESDFDAMLESQGRGCALCGRTYAGGRWQNFHVDHCHETGRIRGILCHGCNVALGQLGDNTAGLSKALAYVAGSPAAHA